METKVEVVKDTELVIKESEIQNYNISLDDIKKACVKYKKLTIDGVKDREGYKAVHDARMVVAKTRIAVKKLTRERKGILNDWKKKIDENEKIVTDILVPVENDLLVKENFIKDEKQRIKDEAAEAAAKKLQDRMDAYKEFEYFADFNMVRIMTDKQFETSLKEVKENFEAAKVAKVEAEKAAKVEADRVAKEAADLKVAQDKLAADQKAVKDAQDKIDADNKKIADAKQKIIDDKKAADQKIIDDAAEVKRVAKIKKDAEEKAKKDLAAKKILDEKKAAKIELLRPDKDKLLIAAKNLQEIKVSGLKTDEAMHVMGDLIQKLDAVHDWLITEIDQKIK